MNASPSIPEIASALTSTLRPLAASSRILCLVLGGPKTSNGLKKPQAVAEAFLKFSPRVQFRAPNLLFLDVASTAHFFKARSGPPEMGVLESAKILARDLGFDVKAAISDTAAGAQAFAQLNSDFIAPPGEERESLQPLSLPLLLHLEGLLPWKSSRAVEHIVTFFYMLGFEKISDLERFSQTSFQDRWGEVGALLWRRMNGLDRQAISPFLPTEALEEYVHLDFPLSITSLLMHQVRRSMQFLFARLQGRCLHARRLVLRLHCEYSQAHHKIEVEPNTPGRDLNLFMTLLENKMDTMDFQNPIREFEIEVIPCPERVHQLDFFEPRTTDQTKLESLFSLLQQSSIRTGRYEIEDAILPERSWRIGSAIAARQQTYEAHGSLALAEPVTEGAYQFLPSYGVEVQNAPRPTRLLRQPRRLPIEELQKLHLLTGQPIERLEDAWWENDLNERHQPVSSTKRDYYFAVSNRGQCVWIYQDVDTQDYFLHGYFD